jgi:hypothetical protein
VLKASVMSAVRSARSALADLLVDVTLRRRTGTHTPGQPVAYSDQSDTVKMAIVEYQAREIDGDRIKWTDKQGILLEEIAANPNDEIVDGSDSYRIVKVMPITVGGSVVATEFQLRPM